MIRDSQNHLFVMAAVVLLLGAGFALAQDEARLLARLHHVNALEIEAGLLAQKKGVSDEVRKLGERVTRDHLLADKKLTRLANRKKIGLNQTGPQTTEERTQHEKRLALFDKLLKLHGADFDAAFLQFMVQGHAQSIRTLKAAREEMEDEQIRNLVNKLIAMLEKQHEWAVELERQAEL